MAKADLHIHSRYSNHPSEWFLQRIGASESYTDPEWIYRTAKERGMRFVTLTDHNSIEGALILREHHPDDFFMGVEATAYFPEDGCKAHVLVYGFDEAQFAEIQRLRTNIYDLCSYLGEHRLACSVAHGTYSVNGKLTADHLEKLILLFDVFEGMNGARSRINNEPWAQIVSSLTPDHIEKLACRHKIEPRGVSPWIKGFTGGTDDHAGLFAGKTYTVAEARTVGDFLAAVRNRRTTCEGNYSDFQTLAFSIYKIAYDFSRTKSSFISQSFLSRITENLFESRRMGLRGRFKFKTLKTLKNRRNDNPIGGLSWDLMDDISSGRYTTLEDKLDSFYRHLSAISDEFFRHLLESLENDLRQGDIPGLVRHLSSSLPGIFLSIPFFSTLRHLHEGKSPARTLAARLSTPPSRKPKRILWFTDTLSYMNGVSMTLRKIGWLGYLGGRDIRIVTSMPEQELTPDLPPNIVNLPSMFEFRLPHYEHYIMRAPSLLASLEILSEYEPDEIYISTPGPVGLFGLLMARILGAKSVAVFHTDFTLQAGRLADDASPDDLVESFLRWFHSLADETHVPTHEYISILEARGYDVSRMRLFRRGIDILQFYPRPAGKSLLSKRFNIHDGPVLLYAGRISRDKNIHFLIELFRRIEKSYTRAVLVIAGDGPDLQELRRHHAMEPRIVFTGRLDHDILPEVYSGADLFVFPSGTDTFGMAVLEAQACGLPAVVSDTGGPQEIIKPETTGSVARHDDPEDWERRVCSFLDLMRDDPKRYSEIREASRLNAVTRFSWDTVMETLAAGGNTDTFTSSDDEHASFGEWTKQEREIPR